MTSVLPSEEAFVQVRMNGALVLASFPCHLDETVAALDARLTERLSLSAAHRILVRGKALRAAESETLRVAGVLSGDSLYVVASDDAAVRAIRAAEEDPLLRGFSRAPSKFPARSRQTGPGAARSMPGVSSYGFKGVRQLRGYPDSARAEELLWELAEDPGFKRVMEEHRWVVGCLSEMEPDGKVGVDPVCVLGYNTNKGAEIHLRLRTDDRKGFRPMFKLKEVLAHELAHNVHSEHDNQFYELMRQVEREARQFDWRQSAGRTTANTSTTRGTFPKSAAVARDPLDAGESSEGPSLSIARRLGTRDESEANPATALSSLVASARSASDIASSPSNPQQPLQPRAKHGPETGLPLVTGGAQLRRSDAADIQSSQKMIPSFTSSGGCKPNSEEAEGERAIEGELESFAASSMVTDPADASGGLQNLNAASRCPDSHSILTAMGFSTGLAKIALRENEDDAGRAADWLAALQTENDRHESSVGSLDFSSGNVPDQELSTRMREALDRLQAEVKDNGDFIVALTTLHAYMYNLLKHPSMDRYRSVNNANSTFRDRIGRYEAGQTIMRTIGFSLDGGRWSLSGTVDLARVWMSKSVIVNYLVNAEAH